ncbi:hypothetical protein [Actinomadura atramentaria]|uniref:hypothetical protein n=1 Tax=Actinomadura atramentaria TaxID=1990 RepID=UPI00036354B0|nr:hypothetical protein [Actinomadura atramentaria]
MAVFSGLVRRVADEAGRRVRDGLGLLDRLTREHGPGADALRLTAAHGDRLDRLESALGRQDAGLRALRADLDALVADVNQRLLPRIDERMDDAERDVAALATGLIRAGKDRAGHQSALDGLDRRVGDVRGRVAALEQRAGLWREVQATVARLGDDLDRLRTRLEATADAGQGAGTAGEAGHPPSPAATLPSRAQNGATAGAEPGRAPAHPKNGATAGAETGRAPSPAATLPGHPQNGATAGAETGRAPSPAAALPGQAQNGATAGAEPGRAPGHAPAVAASGGEPVRRPVAGPVPAPRAAEPAGG